MSKSIAVIVFLAALAISIPFLSIAFTPMPLLYHTGEIINIQSVYGSLPRGNSATITFKDGFILTLNDVIPSLTLYKNYNVTYFNDTYDRVFILDKISEIGDN